jgi:hypothetical protein
MYKYKLLLLSCPALRSRIYRYPSVGLAYFAPSVDIGRPCSILDARIRSPSCLLIFQRTFPSTPKPIIVRAFHCGTWPHGALVLAPAYLISSRLNSSLYLHPQEQISIRLTKQRELLSHRNPDLAC